MKLPLRRPRGEPRLRRLLLNLQTLDFAQGLGSIDLPVGDQLPSLSLGPGRKLLHQANLLRGHEVGLDIECIRAGDGEIIDTDYEFWIRQLGCPSSLFPDRRDVGRPGVEDRSVLDGEAGRLLQRQRR